MTGRKKYLTLTNEEGVHASATAKENKTEEKKNTNNRIYRFTSHNRCG